METKKWKIKLLTFILICKMIQGLKVKLQKIIWNKRSDSNVGDETALEFTICSTQTCDAEKEWTIHSLDHIVKADFQLNKK
ncbi:hypothetical protein ACIQ6U_05250 [Lysinibacillus fusiformis]|uniref:hypothetical protein n=1 Tax=Lysinibacillus fusiformis TaxID=28031 RepID=UPI003810C03E